MKNTVIIFCFFLSAAALYPRAIREETNLTDEAARTSYSFGMVVGADLRQTGFDELDYASFTEGLKAAIEGSETKIDQDEAVEIVRNAFENVMVRQTAEARAKEAEFLRENATRDGINVTESGLQYEVIEAGRGPKPGAGDTVLVHYEGVLTNGTVFDSSYLQEKPEEIPLSMVIPGWSEGIQLMNVGTKFRLFIPSNLAYGEYGVGQVIPPYSTLIFTVELLDIVKEDAIGEDFLEFEEEDANEE
jgi:FKBP-type peptidyl-prolyl cis-trans isomerase